MAFTQNTTPTLIKQPRRLMCSIGNGDASAWKFMYSGANATVGYGANGTIIAGAYATSSDSSSRIVQLAKAITFTGVTISIASPGVVTWSLANGNTAAVGDQVVFLNNGDTLPTGLSFNTTYFVIAGGFTVNTSFELATSAGGTAINTSVSQSGTHVIALIRPIVSQTVAITAGTDGVTAAANFWGLGAQPVNNDGQPYDFLESPDTLCASCTGTVTSNKMISVHAVIGDF